MKTCKDCIYYVVWDDGPEDDPIEQPEQGECHLYPLNTCVNPLHWCGQLKEKVHVISDFPKDETCRPSDREFRQTLHEEMERSNPKDHDYSETPINE